VISNWSDVNNNKVLVLVLVLIRFVCRSNIVLKIVLGAIEPKTTRSIHRINIIYGIPRSSISRILKKYKNKLTHIALNIAKTLPYCYVADCQAIVSISLQCYYIVFV